MLPQNTPQILVYRGECEKNRDCLKNDLKELIQQEKTYRKEGEMELSKGIEKVDGKIDSINSKMTGLLVTLIVGILMFLIEFVMGKL